MASAAILIIDDSQVNLSALRTLLGRDGYELTAAEDGETATTILTTDPSFDVILLSMAMQGVDAVAMCRQIRMNLLTSGIPIILIGAYRTDGEDIQRGLDAGADGYLTQPIEETALRAWVKTALRISRLQRELAVVANGETVSARDLVEHFRKLAHAINNPLQAVYAAADLLSLEVGENESAQELIDDIFTDAERVARLVADAGIRARQHVRPPGRAAQL